MTQNLRGLPARSRDSYDNDTIALLDDWVDYDANGNVLAITDGATGRGQRGNRDMAYDGLDRLTDVASPMYGSTGAHYRYDALDNLTHVTAPGRDHAYCHDPASNQLTNVKAGDCTGATVTGLAYDVQGNLSNKDGTQYAFDYGNRLRAVTYAGATVESYQYDGHGRRVLATSPAGAIASFYGQNGQLLYQDNGREGLAHSYFYLAGSLVNDLTHDTTTGTYANHYQHTDALGSPVVVTNGPHVVLQRSEYEPYGKLVNRAVVDGPGYTGHVSDAATGLSYMQQRYFWTEGGIFLSGDPVGVDTTTAWNFCRYCYATNNPYTNTDPDGRESGAFYTNPQYQMAQPVMTPEAAGLIADFTPVVGDIKGFVDAYNDPSVANIAAAVIGVVGPIGDGAGKALKNADGVYEAAGGVAKGKNIVAPGGREAAKQLFREADSAGKGNRKIKRDETGGGRQVSGRTADGKSLTIRFKADGTTRIQGEGKKSKIIYPEERKK